MGPAISPPPNSSARPNSARRNAVFDDGLKRELIPFFRAGRFRRRLVLDDVLGGWVRIAAATERRSPSIAGERARVGGSGPIRRELARPDARYFSEVSAGSTSRPFAAGLRRRGSGRGR